MIVEIAPTYYVYYAFYLLFICILPIVLLHI